jgi:predicted RNA-binding protein YlqC (UPF0109 family)
MKELIELIVRHLVDQPDAVMIREVDTERGVTFELSVAPEDVGKVIGKGGRTVKSIRNVVVAASFPERKNVSIEIV